MLGGSGIWIGGHPMTRKFTVGFAAVQTAGLTNAITLFALGAKEVVQSVTIKHTQAFSGGSIATCTMSVGIVGSLTKYVAASDVKQAIGDTVQFGVVTSAGTPESHASSTNVQANFISTVANLSALTQGSVDIWVQTVALP